MTENQKNLKIEYLVGYGDNKGVQIQETYDRGRGTEANVPFDAELEYMGYTRGRSALNIEWRDNKRNKIYYSGMPFLHHMLRTDRIKNNNITGTFCFRKQGTSILLDEL